MHELRHLQEREMGHLIKMDICLGMESEAGESQKALWKLYRFKTTNWKTVLEKQAFTWYASNAPQTHIFTTKCVPKGWFVSPLIYRHTSRRKRSISIRGRRQSLSPRVQDSFNQCETLALLCDDSILKKCIHSRGLIVKFSFIHVHQYFFLKWHSKLVMPVLYLRCH